MTPAVAIRGASSAPSEPAVRVFYNRPVAIALLLALCAFECLRGLLPALSRIDTDFPNYFTAARVVASGQSADRLYDHDWFQEQMRRNGFEGQGAFWPFPPPTALILVPLARLEPLTALRVLTAVNVLCLIGAALLLARVLSWSPLDSAVLILLSGNAVIMGLRFGQLYILISAVCILGYLAWLKRRPYLAGIAFGLFVPIKYYPIVILAGLGSRRQWQVVLGGIAGAAGITLLGIAVLGWPLHEFFLRFVLGHHLTANIGIQDPFATAFQSFDTLLRRLFVPDPTWNPRPLWPAPGVRLAGLVVIKASVLIATIAALARLARVSTDTAAGASVGLLGVAFLLIAPATATYHFALLWLAVGLLVDFFLRRGEILTAYIVLGAYALIGFFPYQFTYPFEGRGALTVLAFPRLWLLTALFLACLVGIFRRGPQVVGAPSGMRSQISSASEKV